ncbi:MAG: D-aminoacyl-tRNA deacylase, partial [Bacteroidota bacterium]
MRTVIQRVREASVSINGTEQGAIALGLVVLAGFEDGDTAEDLAWMSGKITRLRIFNDADGKMNQSLAEVDGGVLLISQFTLHASTRKGNRPSYIRAARPEVAIPLYEAFHRQLEADLGKPVPTGSFGADMQVALVNDGPVTIT